MKNRDNEFFREEELDELVEKRDYETLRDKMSRIFVCPCCLNGFKHCRKYLEVFSKEEIRKTPTLAAAEAVIQASIRVCNLCKKIETEVAISSALFADPAEQELHDVLIRLNKELIPDIVTYNYAGALKLADQVVEPVNKFFDSVMVMDENVDIKNNRLALLEQAKEVTNAVGDLSCIVL